MLCYYSVVSINLNERLFNENKGYIMKYLLSIAALVIAAYYFILAVVPIITNNLQFINLINEVK